MLPRIKKSLFFPDDEPAILSLEKSVRSLLTSDTSSTNDRHLLQQYACDLSRSETVETLRNDASKIAEEKRLWTEIEGGSGAVEGMEIGEPQSPQIQKAKKGVTHRRKNGALVTVGDSSTPPTTSTTASTTTSNLSSSRMNGTSTTSMLRPPMGPSSYLSSNGYGSDNGADKPPTWKTNRLDKTKIAVVRPQPQVIITQRSPSPMPPKLEDTKASSKLPLSSK